jgi:hypothetical protein
MINIDDVHLLFPGQIITVTGVNSGYLDENNVMVLEHNTGGRFSLVTNSVGGKQSLDIAMHVLRDTRSYHLDGLDIALLANWIDGVQGFDAQKFLHTCSKKASYYTVANAFDDLIMPIVQDCRVNCRHTVVRNTGDCMMCGKTLTAHINGIPVTGLAIIASLGSWGDEVTPRMDTTPDFKEQWKKDGLCPKCGDKGSWRNLALVCPTHGIFAG